MWISHLSACAFVLISVRLLIAACDYFLCFWTASRLTLTFYLALTSFPFMCLFCLLYISLSVRSSLLLSCLCLIYSCATPIPRSPPTHTQLQRWWWHGSITMMEGNLWNEKTCFHWWYGTVWYGEQKLCL